MLAVEKKKKYTVDDYMLLEEGAPFQLINYDLVLSSVSHTSHQAIVSRLSQLTLNFLNSNKNEGYVAVSVDVVFDEGNIFRPDVVYVAEERIEEIVKDRIEGVPDLVIEILSLSSAYYDLRQKMDIYEKYGVKEYVIIDPIAQNADLYALKEGVYYLHQRAQKAETLNSLILPGFQLEMDKIFQF